MITADPSSTLLVGRGSELSEIQREIEDALAGRPRTLVVEGEAGVGKTTLVTVGLKRARQQGFAILTGRCDEDSSVPFEPVLNAIGPIIENPPRSLGTAHVEELRRATTPAAGPSVRSPDGSGPGTEIPTDDGQLPRQRLAAAIGHALRSMAANSGAVLALEDIHWADPDTLDLLGRLVLLRGTDTGPSILLVLTMRPVPTGHPAAGAVQHLIHAGAHRLRLGGLDEVSVRELLAAHGVDASGNVSLAIMERTNGNPLLLRSLAAQLETREGSRQLAQPDRTLDQVLPLGTNVETQAHKRLRAVSRRTRNLLTMAAFLGFEESLTRLRSLTGLDQEAFDAAMDEAEDAQLLRAGVISFTFPHPVIREALYHGPTTGERQRLHLAVAEMLEHTESSDGPRHDLEIAHHLRRAGDLPAPERIAGYAVLAATHSDLMASWSKAARYWDLALQSRPCEPEDRARLHLAAATAHFRNSDLGASARHARACADLARDSGDLTRWGDAVMLRARALVTHERDPGQRASAVRSLGEYVDAVASEDEHLATLALCTMAEVLFENGNLAAGRQCAERALRLTDGTSEPTLRARALFAAGILDLGTVRLAQAESAFEDSATAAGRVDTTGSAWISSWSTGRLPLVLWAQGRLDQGLSQAEHALDLSRRKGIWSEASFTAAMRVGMQVLQGSFADSERTAEEADLFYRRWSYHHTPDLLLPAVAAGRALRGDRVGAEDALEKLEEATGRNAWRLRHLVAVELGDLDSVRSALAERQWQATAEEGWFAIAPLAAMLEVGTAAGRPDLVASSHDRLAEIATSGVQFTTGWPHLLTRLLGSGAAVLGRQSEAAAYLAIAVRQAGASGARVEHARSLAALGAVLLAGGPEYRSRAQGTLVRAVRALDELGMLPAHERARALLLGAFPDAPLTPPRERTILFSDIVDSTKLNVDLGNEQFVRALDAHNRLTRDCLRRHDGVEFKHTGDGIGAWFTHAHDAVACAVEMHSSMTERNRAEPREAINLRIGVASGQAIGLEGDLFGLSVVAAARICAAAGAGEVLVPRDLRSTLVKHGFQVASAGRHEAKGFPTPFDLDIVRSGPAM